MTVQDLLNTCKGLDPATPVKLLIANDPYGVQAITLLGPRADPDKKSLGLWLHVEMAGDEEDEEDDSEEEEVFIEL